MAAILVLVRTHNPGNVGAAARAAKCFGAELLLYASRTERDHADAEAFASGAVDVLRSAGEVTTWDQVRERADLLIGLSSLRGRLARGLPPAMTWAAVRREAAARPTALVIGPERSGLTTDELLECDARLAIGTRPEFPTLSIAQAAAVALALAAPTRKGAERHGRSGATASRPASASGMARLLERWRSLMRRARYARPGLPRAVLAELESLLRRARPSEREATLLLGALAALEHQLDKDS